MNNRSFRRLALLMAGSVLAGLLLVGCGQKDEPGSTGSTGGTTTAPTGGGTSSGGGPQTGGSGGAPQRPSPN